MESLEFQKSQDQVQQALESNLIILSPNLNSYYVGNLINELYSVLEDFSVDSTLFLEKPGSVFYNLEMNKVSFCNYGDPKCRTALTLNNRKFLTLVKNDFHLFPNSGK